MIKKSLWKENTKQLDTFTNSNIEELVYFTRPLKNKKCVVHVDYADIVLSTSDILNNVDVRCNSMPSNVVWCIDTQDKENLTKSKNIEVYYFLSEKLINEIGNINASFLKELGVAIYRIHATKDIVIREKHKYVEGSYNKLHIGKSIDILLKYLDTKKNTEVIQKIPLNKETKMTKGLMELQNAVKNYKDVMAKLVNNTMETKVEDGFTKEGRWFRRSRFVLGVGSGIGLYHLMTHLDDRGVQTVSGVLGLVVMGLVGLVTAYSGSQALHYWVRVIATLLTGKGIPNYNKNSIKFLKYSGMLGGSLITLEYIQPGIIQKVIAMVV